MTRNGDGRSRFVLRIAAVVLAVALQAVVGWFTLVSGLVAPLWAVAALGVLWLAATALLIRVARRRPLVAPVIPAVNALVWWGSLMLGGSLLGWTA